MFVDVTKSSDGLPLVVASDQSGSGVSALLATFAETHAEEHPADVIISHCIHKSKRSMKISFTQY